MGAEDPSTGGGEWQPRVTADGSLTLVHPGHGEACHSDAGAWLEAWERYVLAARVPESLRARRAGARALRLLDVGTAVGWNIAALRVARESHAPGAPLEVTTLEIDRGVIDAALATFGERDAGAHAEPLREVHAALRLALERGNAEPVPLGRRDTLRLCLGDARTTLPALDPSSRYDVVFLDPFSPGVDPALWEPGFLSEVAARMAPGSWLSTYSAATAVRVALLAAGLRVGPGPRVGRKAEGTVATPDGEPPPFEPRVARRIARRGEELRPSGGSVAPQTGETEANDRKRGPRRDRSETGLA